MKFLVDAHFPVGLKKWLIKKGHDPIQTTDLPHSNKTPDLEIIKKAASEGRIVITKDSDFIKYRIVYGLPDILIMVTTGNIINKDLLELFELNFDKLEQLLQSGSKVIEIDNKNITVIE